MIDKYTNSKNPILPLKYHIPDGEAHVMPDGNLYIYGSYDDLDDFYCSQKYYVVSTPDMKEWIIHEKAFDGNKVFWFNDPNATKYKGIDWENPTEFIKKMQESEESKEEKEKIENGKEPLLFAPDCIYRDGKYYLYFCMSDDQEGVAISDKPEGPFENPKQLPCGGIDPAVFIDDDNQAYYYWGQLFSKGVKLNSDMVSFDRTKIVDNLVTEEEHYFHEGSSMRKINDTYYLVYSCMERGKPTALGYSTSKSPLGPFTYRGIIIDNEKCDPKSWNNHGSIEYFKGRWYVFYHRSSRNSKYHRRLCIEPIEILEDGKIPEVKMTTQGPGRSFISEEKIYGYQACELEGTIYIDEDGMGSEWLTNISNGDSAIFRYVESDEAFKEAEIVSKGTGIVKIYLEEKEVGIVNINSMGNNTVSLKSIKKEQPMELKLSFSNPKELKIISITLS